MTDRLHPTHSERTLIEVKECTRCHQDLQRCVCPRPATYVTRYYEPARLRTRLRAVLEVEVPHDVAERMLDTHHGDLIWNYERASGEEYAVRTSLRWEATS